MNTIQGVSTYAVREGFLGAGIEDGDVLIFSELMDSRSLFLTANADTVYFLGFLDLSDGPLVLGDPLGHLGPHRRHVVPLDHRLRSPRRRTAARAAATCCSVRATTDRCPRVALYVRHSAHQPRDSARPGVHRPERGQRPRSDRDPDQGAAEDLPLRPRRRGQQHRRLPDRPWPARPAGGAAESPVRGGDRAGDEHDPAQRLRPLRDAGRAGADGAGRGARHRAGRSVRRHRDRQGREVRAGHSAARDPRRGGGRRQRGLTDARAWARTRPRASASTTTTRHGGSRCGLAGSTSPTRRR